ncbi:unnamed protein product [Peronospora destructor]|nr:unnamed protein product [Peronospora destructor]
MISVFNNAHDVLLCVPGILGGALLFIVSRRYDNSFILSGSILIMPIVFFFILLIGGISVNDARDGGWIDPAKDPATVSDLIGLFDFSLVHWDQLPKQFETWIGMAFIVALSSCLDIAAIELEMGKKLDLNHELKTGWLVKRRQWSAGRLYGVVYFLANYLHLPFQDQLSHRWYLRDYL